MDEPATKPPDNSSSWASILVGYLFVLLFSGVLSPVLCAALYGRDTRDVASRWGFFPVVHFGVWLLAVLVAYPIVLLFTSRVPESESRARWTAFIAAIIVTIVTVAYGSQNPDRQFFTR